MKVKPIEDILSHNHISFRDISVDWDALKAINPDIVGWIVLRGTNINYPILKGKNNDEYLYHLYTKEYSIAGSIFVDFQTEEPFEQDLTILYRHRMKDGSMFATLKYYFWEEYYPDHPIMEMII